MGTQSFTASIMLGPTPHPSWATVLQIPKFELGRPLLKLDLSIRLQLRNVLGFESTSGLASRATVSHASQVTVTDLAGRPISVALANEATKTLSRRDGATDFAGTSGFETTCSRVVEDSCSIINVTPYIGQGLVDFNVVGSAESRFLGPAAGSFRTATDYEVVINGTYTYVD